MLVPVFASVGLVRAFCGGYERESRNGSSIFSCIQSGLLSFAEEGVRTVVSYKIADMAFYAARLGLTRFGFAALGGPVGLGLSCLAMAAGSVWGNQLITDAANRVKFALKIGYPT